MRRRRERDCKTKPKERQRLNKVMGKEKSMNRLEACCFTHSLATLCLFLLDIWYVCRLPISFLFLFSSSLPDPSSLF